MLSVDDIKVSIELLNHRLPLYLYPMGTSRFLPNKADFFDITDVLLMVTDVYPMVTNVYLMVAEESSVANPQKVANIDENIRKIQKDGLATNSSVLLVVIEVIGSHRCHRLIIEYCRWHQHETQYIAAHREQS
jgi:hypothetical protein